HAGDGGELVLEGGGHSRGHGFGTGAGQIGGHQQRGQVHVGKIAHGQRAVGDPAEQGDSGHQQAGGDGPLDEGLRNVHASVHRLHHGSQNLGGSPGIPPL